MPIIFDWREVDRETWLRRYGREEFIGFALWREFWPRLDDSTPASARNLVDAFVRGLRRAGREFNGARGRRGRPCVFVSHRQADVALADRIARDILRLAPHYDVWLDIWDPALAGVGQPVSPQAARRIAMIIEMALVNSTHVLAVMTKNSAGSLWIPYEYGRIKEGFPFADEAAAWIEPSCPPAALPEYMHLGWQLHSPACLTAWL